MIAQSAEWRNAHGHIRPFHLHRDLADLAALIEAAFGSELRDAQSPILRDMRQMALMGPLLLAAGSAVAPFAGFVWIEGGRLVGNVSYGRETGCEGACSVSNVAVLPEFRGRGIAGRLLDATLSHLCRQGCRRVFLEVRAVNEPAKALYRKRGFAVYYTVHELLLPAYGWPVILGATERPLRQVRAQDGLELYRLYLASTPPGVLRARPQPQDGFRRGLRWRLAQVGRYLSGGEVRSEWVGEERGRIVAFGALTTYLSRRPCEVEMVVHPSERGAWEHALAETILHRGPATPMADARATIGASHPEALEALSALGFRTQRVLDHMVLELGGE